MIDTVIMVRLTGGAGAAVTLATAVLMAWPYQARSKIAATPWPPPTHMVSRP